MKHIFIVNPAAGKENATEHIKKEIENSGIDVTWEIYETKERGDATEYLKKYLETHPDPVRVYACGGDGTLNEVVNGVVGYAQASISCYPCGSGNDFIKYYGGMEAFASIINLINGDERPIDIIKVGDRYAINAVHFGFDSCVAQKISELRRKPIIGGRNAYASAVAYALVKGMHHQCNVVADGDCMNPSGELCLCTIANGQYVGGSYRCAPKSWNDDGMLDVCIVDRISRYRFLRVMGPYQRGEHLDNPDYKSFIYYKRVNRVHVTAPAGFVVSMDGELLEMNDFEVCVMPQATRFVVPRGAKCIAPAKTEKSETGVDSLLKGSDVQAEVAAKLS